MTHAFDPTEPYGRNDPGENAPPTMRCPHCGSTDVECHENTARHVHECNACGHKDIYRGNDA